MPSAKKIVASCLIAVAAAAWAETRHIIESLTPDFPKKVPPGYAVEGVTVHYRDAFVDVQLAPLIGGERAPYFAARGFEDPFSSVLPAENLILFRLRLENLHKSHNVDFSPTATMLGDSLAFDDSYVYQFLYKEANPDAKLGVAGKTMYLTHLSLPPGQWIERLLAFQYDDPYAVKHLVFQIGGLSAGSEGIALTIPYKTKFRKEKEN